ncbi:MAG: alpha/beta fold hydrolase [Candidatus Thorarchaeota archaeon]
MPRFDYDDISMFYKTAGEGDPVLLIHGLGGDHRGWEFQEKDLAARFHIIMPDLRGHGQTTVEELGMMIPPNLVADDLNALLEHLGHEMVHVVGISLGGLVAQNFVLRYPKRVDKLVLVDTTPKITEDLIDVVYSWREAQVEGGDEAYFWTSLRSGYSDEWIENNPDMVQYLKEKSADTNDEGVLAAGLGFSTIEFTEQLSNIKAKTLVIHGEDDRIMKLELGRMLHDGIKGSKLKVLEGCGHSPTVQMTDEFNDILITFLSTE